MDQIERRDKKNVETLKLKCFSFTNLVTRSFPLLRVRVVNPQQGKCPGSEVVSFTTNLPDEIITRYHNVYTTNDTNIGTDFVVLVVAFKSLRWILGYLYLCEPRGICT